MTRTRQILVLTLVATALCADRVTTAMPEVRAPLTATVDPIARLASKLASRLSGTFRQQGSAACLQQKRCDDSAVTVAAIPSARPLALHAAESSPFRFRLPPPAL